MISSAEGGGLAEGGALSAAAAADSGASLGGCNGIPPGAGAAIEANSSAAIMLYENRWAAPFAAALRRGGAQLVARGGVPLDALAASLDAAEAS